MTRFKLRAMFALGGLIFGAAIWATAGVSQDSPPPQGPAALPRSAATAADDTTERSAVPPARSEATFDPNPPQKPGTNTPNATPLVPGETATERLDRLRANSVAPAAPNGQPTLDVLGRMALDRAGAAPQQPIVGEMPPLRIIPAQGVNASSLKEIVETLIPTARGQIAVDAQSNSLVVRVPDATFDEIKKLALNLQEMKPAAPKGNEPPRGRGPRGGSGPGGGSGFGAGLEGVGGAGTFSGMSRGDGGKRLGEPVVAPQVSLAELKRDYERADKAARDFAATMKSNSNRNDDSMASLQNRIAYAFSLRQTFLRVELAEMQRRVTMIQESIDLRDQVAQQIIERRVSELLDPNLQWEPASTPAIGPGGLINSNEVQSPRPMGLPAGTGPREMDREPRSGIGMRGAMLPEADPARASFTNPAAGVPSADLTPALPTYGSGTGAGEAGEGFGPGSGTPPSASNAADLSDDATAAKSGPLWMLHMSAPWRGAERDAPAIVIDANEQRSILLSASWSAQRFPIGEEGAPIESMTLVGSKRPVRLIAADEQLGVAIYSVPGKLVTWPVNWFSSDVRVGDVLHEALGGHHVAMPGAARRVESLGNTFVSGSSIPKDAKVAGTFVLDGRMSGNPGSILLKNGLLAGMFLDNSQSTDASGQKPHVLPTKALLEHAHQLIERSEGEARQKLIQR